MVQSPRWGRVMRKSIALLSVAFLLSSAAALGASTTSPDVKGLWLTADYPAATVRAGDEARFNLSLINYGLAPQRTDLSIESPPKGWEVELRGGGRPVAAAFVDHNAKSANRRRGAWRTGRCGPAARRTRPNPFGSP